MQSLYGGVLMAETEVLRTIVSDLMMLPAESLDSSTVLGGVLSSSLGRARLDAALRSRLSIANPAVYTVKTFGELCRVAGADISGETANSVVEAKSRPGLVAAGHGGATTALGIDIQSVASLPDASDYWETEFYQQHFTRQEIAYALLQTHPRESFAAAWCAKEALRKADNRWLSSGWKDTELTHDEAGKPELTADGSPIPCSVSLSHTEGIAVAVVAMHGSRTSNKDVLQAAPQTGPILSISPLPAPSKIPLVLSAVAFLASLAAVYFALQR
jgi:phosphopantetheine--protein transferase-like protein